jgi:hypothetical protein
MFVPSAFMTQILVSACAPEAEQIEIAAMIPTHQPVPV